MRAPLELCLYLLTGITPNALGMVAELLFRGVKCIPVKIDAAGAWVEGDVFEACLLELERLICGVSGSGGNFAAFQS